MMVMPQMISLLQPLAAEASVAETSILNFSAMDVSATSTLAMPDPFSILGADWLYASASIADLLILAVWQGAVIAAVAAVLLALLRHAPPVWRYAIATTALALLTALPLVTWTLAPAPSPDVSAPPAPAVAPVAPPAPSVQAAPTLDVDVPAPASASSRSNWAESVEEMMRSGQRWVMESVVPAPVASAAASARTWGQKTAPWWVAAWLAGVAVAGVKVLGGVWWIRRVRRSARPLPPSLRPLVVSAAHRAGTRTSISVKQSPRIDVPLVSGWLSPVVLLPTRMIAHTPEEELEALLVHEFTHIRRHDVPVGWLQAVTEALLFFHPAAWWLSSEVRREREHGTDDHVTHVGVSPVVYARALTRVAESVADAGSVPRVTLAPAASDGELLHRIRRMVTGTPEPVRRRSLVVATLALLITPVMLTACSSGEKATTAGTEPEAAPTATDSEGRAVIIERRGDAESDIERLYVEKTDGDSIRVRSMVRDGDSLVIDSTWTRSFDADGRFAFGARAFDVEIDTARIREMVRNLEVETDSLTGRIIRWMDDGSETDVFTFGRYSLDSLRSAATPFDSLKGLRFSPDSLSARIERGLRSRDSLRLVLPERFGEPFPKGLRPDVFRFKMENKDRLRLQLEALENRMQELRDEEPERLRERARRLREEAERMEQRAQEMEESGEAVESGEAGEPGEAEGSEEENDSPPNSEDDGSR